MRGTPCNGNQAPPQLRACRLSATRQQSERCYNYAPRVPCLADQRPAATMHQQAIPAVQTHRRWRVVHLMKENRSIEGRRARGKKAKLPNHPHPRSCQKGALPPSIADHAHARSHRCFIYKGTRAHAHVPCANGRHLWIYVLVTAMPLDGRGRQGAVAAQIYLYLDSCRI